MQLGNEIRQNHIAIINGNKHVKKDGGIAIANALGFGIDVGEVSFDQELGAWKAHAKLVDLKTREDCGVGAWGYVGDDEDRWVRAPKNARYSMTQTRAQAKLCVSNFGHMYVALGADQSTPAEEMPVATNTTFSAPATLTTKTTNEERRSAPLDLLDDLRGKISQYNLEDRIDQYLENANVKTINELRPNSLAALRKGIENEIANVDQFVDGHNSKG